jgi:hypothetical protein
MLHGSAMSNHATGKSMFSVILTAADGSERSIRIR